MRFRNVFAAVCVTALAACSSFDVKEPVQGSVVTLPNMVPVNMIGKPEILGNVEVRAGTTDLHPGHAPQPLSVFRRAQLARWAAQGVRGR